MQDSRKINVFWLRRDLRLQDNCGLYHCLKAGLPVLVIFIFDQEILNDLRDSTDPRVSFIHSELEKINDELKTKGSRLKTFYNTPIEAFKSLAKEEDINAVYTNRDYEPYAIKRDQQVKGLLEDQGIDFKDFKDHVIFEKNEVVKDDGQPYLVYTPYSKKWMSSINEDSFYNYTTDEGTYVQRRFESIISLADMGFKKSEIEIPSKSVNTTNVINYEAERNFPAKDSTSRLGVHLRFGTISPRQLAKQAKDLSLTYYKELIWREFFMMILFHFPHVVEHNYKPKYDGINWRNKKEEFELWKAGKTGYPLVDAGMRELNSTGFMHNRVRMVVASFLCKHLLIDWKWGEAYFAEKLLDYELASNNGNWQWCAGTGVDASPYFRVFNPSSQIDKFDKNNLYIRRWVKDFNTASYTKPMVEHKMARERAIDTYKKGLANA